MKRIISAILVMLLCLGFAATALADNYVDEYYEKIKAGAPWTEYDYNVTYQNSAKDVLPDCISGSKTTLKASDFMLFGDETGAVWAIIGQEMYRVWFSDEGNLVLTSTSEGFGYTGYGVFTPKTNG